jgi:hypothetical protein
VEDNILCLCPNHHVMFDAGSFSIAEDLTLLGLAGRLRVVKGPRRASAASGRCGNGTQTAAGHGP